ALARRSRGVDHTAEVSFRTVGKRPVRELDRGEDHLCGRRHALHRLDEAATLRIVLPYPSDLIRLVDDLDPELARIVLVRGATRSVTVGQLLHHVMEEPRPRMVRVTISRQLA